MKREVFKSLSEELRGGFLKRVIFSALTVTLIGFGLHITWTIYQKSVLEKQIRDAIAYTLEEPIRNHDLISMKRIIQAFSQANANADICLKLSDNVVLGNTDCDISSFQSYSVPLKNESFSVGVILPRFDKMVWTGILFLAASILILIFVTRYLFGLSLAIMRDLNNLFSHEDNPLQFSELREAKVKIVEGLKLQAERHEMKAQIVIGEMAAMVAHDLESPLAALYTALIDIKEVREEKRTLALKAMARIRDICNQLLSHRRQFITRLPLEKSSNQEGIFSLGETAPILLHTLIDELISEKRLQYKSEKVDIEFLSDSNSFGLFVNAHDVELKRVFSNLINNSIEAAVEKATIQIRLLEVDSNIKVEIHDNGKGISKALLPTILDEGKSIGKGKKGSGLGLRHAKYTIEGVGGKLSIDSKEGLRTVVSVILPKASPPTWFLSHLHIPHGAEIVVLDDDPSIHAAWAQKFSNFDLREKNISVLNFSSALGFHLWNDEQKRLGKDQKRIHLFDHELVGEKTTGLDLLENLTMRGAINCLVTSHFDQEDIRKRCELEGIMLISKMMIASLPISIGNHDQCEIVLIDDDLMTHNIWKLGALRHKKKLGVFQTAEDFLGISNGLNHEVKIYVDKNLGNGISGLAVAQNLHARGFRNLYLTTGDRASTTAVPGFLKGIIGKHFPDDHG